MGCLSKSLALLIILILTVSSVILVKPTFAQQITKPTIQTVIIGFSSPQNETYNTNSLILNVTLLVEPASGNERGLIESAYYSLDGQGRTSIPLFYQGIISDDPNVMFPYSVTFSEINLPWLSNGEHNVSVYAWSKPYTGYGALNGSATKSFSVLTNLTTSSPTPKDGVVSTVSIIMFTVIIALLLMAVGIASLLLYRKYRLKSP
jgi:hypothetical protein